MLERRPAVPRRALRRARHRASPARCSACTSCCGGSCSSARRSRSSPRPASRSRCSSRGMGMAIGGSPTHPIAFALVFDARRRDVLRAGRRQRAGVPPDATIGVTYAVAAAAGILLIAKAAHRRGARHLPAGQHPRHHARRHAVLLAVDASRCCWCTSLFYKEFLFVSFDRETARTLGYSVTFWNLLLYFTLGLVIAFAMQFAGVMLVFNFLVLPAVTGLLLARSMRGIFTVADRLGAARGVRRVLALGAVRPAVGSGDHRGVGGPRGGGLGGSPDAASGLKARVRRLCLHRSGNAGPGARGSVLRDQHRSALSAGFQRLLQAAESGVGADARLVARRARVAPVHRVRASRRSRADAQAERARARAADRHWSSRTGISARTARFAGSSGTPPPIHSDASSTPSRAT